MVRVRFAPSPTGLLHLGNLRPAIHNWLFAKARDGVFVLRLDDTDRVRSRDEYAEAIVEDLTWLGLVPDETVRQSDRLDRYEAAAEGLRAAGMLYPCYESAEELEEKRSAALAAGRPPIYDRAALRLSEAERMEMDGGGRRPHWRFRLPNFRDDALTPERTEIVWDDLVRGKQTVDLGSLSDPVLVREDGAPLYTFTSVVDDSEMAISHVIRGEDHVTNTGVQLAILSALGAAVPVFGHLNLLTRADGEGLSKRSGALSLRALRQDGYEPMALASLAALTGAAGSIEALPTLEALAGRVDLAAVSSSSARFDPSDLDRLNADLVHAMPPAAVAERLRAFGVPDEEADAFWIAIRGNCAKVSEAADWWRIVRDGPAGGGYDIADRTLLDTAWALLPPAPWDRETWKAWTDAVKAATGRKGKALFLPLRLALTGLDHGPELAALLPVIGRERTLARRP